MHYSNPSIHYLSLGSIFTRLEKLVGLVNSVKTKKVNFPSTVSFHRHVYRITLVNFSTISNLFYIICKIYSIMYLANATWFEDKRMEMILLLFTYNHTFFFTYNHTKGFGTQMMNYFPISFTGLIP